MWEFRVDFIRSLKVLSPVLLSDTPQGSESQGKQYESTQLKPSTSVSPLGFHVYLRFFWTHQPKECIHDQGFK